MNHIELAISAALLLCLYLYVAARVSEFYHSDRMELVDRAEKLLSHPDLHVRERSVIILALDELYSYRGAWRIATMMLPIMIWSTINRGNEKELSRVNQLPHKRELAAFLRSSIICILTNSLAATIIAALAFLVAIAFHLQVRSFTNLLSIFTNLKSQDDQFRDVRA